MAQGDEDADAVLATEGSADRRDANAGILDANPLLHVLAWILAIAGCVAFAAAIAWLAAGLSHATLGVDWSDLGRGEVSTVEQPPAKPLPPPVATRNETGAMITNPSWRVRPRGEYPRRARSDRGSVTLECRVTATGQLEACTVVEETPIGEGFGEAALKGAEKASLYPRTVNGVAHEGRIRFSIRFSLQ
jgi:TonB family protein